MKKYDLKRKAAALIISGILALCGTAPLMLRSSAQGMNLNMSGVPNRHISVDFTGHSENYSAVLYNNTNGLPTSEANAIAETSDGFIWIGSYAGLIRYDGNTFERMDSTSGVGSVTSLYVDSEDRLWIGTNDNGIAMLEKGEFRKWGKKEGMASTHVRAITQDSSGTVYAATTCGIAMISPDGDLTMIQDEAVAGLNMRSIRAGYDGLIYGLSNFGDILTFSGGHLK